MYTYLRYTYAEENESLYYLREGERDQESNEERQKEVGYTAGTTGIVRKRRKSKRGARDGRRKVEDGRSELAWREVQVTRAVRLLGDCQYSLFTRLPRVHTLVEQLRVNQKSINCVNIYSIQIV